MIFVLFWQNWRGEVVDQNRVEADNLGEAIRRARELYATQRADVMNLDIALVVNAA